MMSCCQNKNYGLPHQDSKTGNRLLYLTRPGPTPIICCIPLAQKATCIYKHCSCASGVNTHRHKDKDPLPIMLQHIRRLLNRAYTLIRTKLLNGPYVRLDAPGPRGLNLGVFNHFSGWAFYPEERPITGVEVFQGDKMLGACSYGLKRKDVYTAYSDFPQAETCGFSGWIFIPFNAEKTLRLYSRDEKGRRCLLCTRKPVLSSLISNKAVRAHIKTCLPGDIPAQILIAGMAKTATTALFFKIANSLAACEEAASKTKLLFEPIAYKGTEHERVLAKIILAEKTPLTLWGEKSRARWVNYADFKNFNRKIMLLRDPRDRLISTLLYSTWGQAFRTSPDRVNLFLALLEKKELDPASVSVLELIEARLCSFNSSLPLWKDSLTANLNYFLDFRRNQNDFFNYKYEDFVRGKTQALENFLGFSLAGEAKVEGSLDRVVRTKKSGDWQNWFSEADVAFFKPIFKNFMQELGYEDSWSLPDHQVVLPAHASDYVRKNIRS